MMRHKIIQFKIMWHICRYLRNNRWFTLKNDGIYVMTIRKEWLDKSFWKA